MTLVSLPSPIAWPGLVGNFGSAPSFGNVATLDAAGEYMAYAFVAREDMVVSHVGIRVGTVSGAPTADVRIETLDSATGLPSGTLWATDTNGASGTLTSGSSPLIALTASATIAKSQVFCVKIAYSSGTSFIVQNINQMGLPQTTGLPYQIINTGTPTKSAMSNSTANIALGSSSTVFYQVQGAFPATTSTNVAFNNTNSAKRGLRFTIPMNCRAIGIRWYNNSSVGDYNAILFSDAGSELSSSSTAYEGDNNAGSNNSVTNSIFDSTVELTAGTTYRIALEPTSATNIQIQTVTLPSADYRGASPAKTTAHYTTFATSSWTDSATDQLPFMDLLIDQLDDGAGSGSSVVGVIGG